MYHFPHQTTAVGLVAEAWRRNLPGEAQPSIGRESPEVPVRELAVRVAALEPTMPAKDREHFIEAFARVWPRIDSSGESAYRQQEPYFPPAYDEEVLKAWITVMATRRKPVASASRLRIAAGDELAYPREYEAMKISPGDFGTPKPDGGRIRYVPRLSLTHRQLALHVEFAPLVAVVFLASRLPGGFFGARTMSGPGFRPQVTTLLEVLLARRPDNMTDDQFVPYVRWLIDFRFPLWPEIDDCIVG